MPSRRYLSTTIATVFSCVALTPGAAAAFDHPFIGQFHTITSIASTVPANGDVNPYGIVTVPRNTGALVRGDTLVSNFNNEENLQGTGTTIVQISPAGALSVFAKIDPSSLPGPCPGGVGLTTALAILPRGFVVVGSLPTSNGQAATAQAGCLIVLDSKGRVVQTISGPPINGPWDMTSVDQGNSSTLFVTNVLNGTVASGETPIDEGTVVRIRVRTHDHRPLQVGPMEVIATGFPERTDPAALVVGPTGVGVGEEGTLYVADTQGNRIAAVPERFVPPDAAGRRRGNGRRGRLPEQPAGAHDHPQRGHPHRQRERREPRRDDPRRRRVPAPGHRSGRRRAVRAHRGSPRPGGAVCERLQ